MSRNRESLRQQFLTLSELDQDRFIDELVKAQWKAYEQKGKSCDEQKEKRDISDISNKGEESNCHNKKQ